MKMEIWLKSLEVILTTYYNNWTEKVHSKGVSYLNITRRHSVDIPNGEIEYVLGFDARSTGGRLPGIQDYAAILFFIADNLGQ